MLTKANFRVPTRLLETIQSCGHNPLRTGIAVTTQGSLEDKTFKAMTTEDKETVNSGLFFFFLLCASWFCSVRLFAFFLALKSVTDVAFFTKAMIRARNVGAQRVGVAVMSIAKTLVEINTVRSVGNEATSTVAFVRANGIDTIGMRLAQTSLALVNILTLAIFHNKTSLAKTKIRPFCIFTQAIFRARLGQLITLVHISTIHFAVTSVSVVTSTAVGSN